VDRGLAPAKINLTLHVTGLRSDGYHLLDSLVVFASVGDQITVAPADHLSLSVSGPFAQGVPVDDSNLVLRAARALQLARGVRTGAAVRLVKNLPHAAGIGGGSSDAAATLRLLASHWGVQALHPADPAVAALGADVPVCLAAPHPLRMRGVGDKLTALPTLPPAALVLVNPRAALPTRDVFAALLDKDQPAMDTMPGGLSFDGLCQWLSRQRNDLTAPAEKLAPPVAVALKRLRALPGVGFATMSGSGATCVGLCRDMGAARQAARAMQLAEQNWWVVPAELLTPPVAVQASRATT
jgi:4-diphosphocytidyl-2-C-methyl-D-erythritol kinase